MSAHLYCRLNGAEGGQWAWNLVLSGTLFPAPLFLMFCFLNTVAIAYNSQTALPFGTILVIICIWALVTLPLTGANPPLPRPTPLTVLRLPSSPRRHLSAFSPVSVGGRERRAGGRGGRRPIDEAMMAGRKERRGGMTKVKESREEE